MLRLAHEYAPVTTDDLEGYLKSTFEDDKLENVEAGLRSVELPKNTFLLRPLLGKVADPFVEYLLTRGLTLDEIHAMQTHICPVPGTPLYRRVLWPVYGGAKQLVSWNARTIDADTPKHKKYYVCPDSDINKTLWPYLLPQTKRVVLVEGILDCMAVRRFYNDCYATFGKKLSAAQRDLLKTWGVEEVVLLWDKRDAKKEIMKTVEELKLGFKVFVPNFDVWPTKCDPGDALRLPELVPSLQQMVNMPIDVESFQYLSFCL